ncbi:MAG TPA: CYTH and CHAD domain-containing protein [Burkholderiaceae bacterium]|nr:CYTH and CHAD domain-containing protein [Burkholderiaceae bacterium]
MRPVYLGLPMLERELKLHVPAAGQARVEEELKRLGATGIALHACYFDTENRDLAMAGVALRLRQEGDRWVQTIKAPGPDELSRIETNHERPGPELDLSVYRDTPLESLLAPWNDTLALRYETQISRLAVRHDTGQGIIELAYDRGWIKAGGLRLAVHELELEQISGDTANLFMLGREWLNKHGLLIDLRSKAERGDALAQAVRTFRDAIPPKASRQLPEPVLAQSLKARRAEPVTLDPSASVEQAYQRCANECLNQIIRNAAFLAGVDSRPRAGPDLRVAYVHQLRVGMRRLRSCWKFFGKWLRLDEALPLDELRRYFSLLGQTRDHDVVQLSIAPRLAKAGMPALPETAATHGKKAAQDMRALAASGQFQSFLLDLLERLLECGAESRARARPKHVRSPGKQLSSRLNKWLRQACDAGEHFRQLPAEAQHDLRKDVKRLRYSLDFSASLMKGKRLLAIRSALALAQETLGELNDLYVAQAHYAPLAASQPNALFALGWLKAAQEHKQTEAQAAFKQLAKAGPLKAR